MKANIINHRNSENAYELELSEIEMGVIMEALSAYKNQGYQERLNLPIGAMNPDQVRASEKLHKDFNSMYNS